MVEIDDIGSNEQKAVAKGRGSLAINAAQYANVTVYQYVTYSGDKVTVRETIDPSRCPYPGLETFRTSEAKYFAGREDDVAELKAKLRDHNICGVIAASGAGKSSLVHAGLIPALAEREAEAWDVFAFKPGDNPLLELAKTLSGVLAADKEIDDQRKQAKGHAESLQLEPGVLAEYIQLIRQSREASTNGKHHQVLIFVDQWEELYTTENNVDRDILVRELIDVARRGLAKVLLTMRIDFMKEMLELSSNIFKALKPGIHYVEPMNEIGLRSAIQLPDGGTGLEVPENLTSRLIADLGKGRNHRSLPYLQFVLRQLWEKRDQATNKLTTEAYEEMKGLKGAIGAHADDEFRKLSKEEQGLAKRVLPRLANVSEFGAITSRRLPFADFDEQARDLLRKLAEPERRLIVLSSATEDVAEAEIVAEVAHEALLDDWKTLSGWIADRKDFFRLRNKLEADAKAWVENDKNPDFLIPAGKPLLDAEDLLTKALPSDLSAALGVFVSMSAEKKKQDDERRIEEEHARQKAEAEQLKREKEQAVERERLASELSQTEAVRANEAEKSERALKTRNKWLIGLAAVSVGVALGAGYFWNQSVSTQRDLEKEKLSALDLNRELVKTSDNLARQLWLTKKNQYELFANRSISESTEERFADALVSALRSWPENAETELPQLEASVRALQNATAGNLVQVVYDDHGGRVDYLRFSSDGERIFSGGLDESVQVRDAKTGAKIHEFSGHLKSTGIDHLFDGPNGCVKSVAEDLTHNRYVTKDCDGKVRVWNVVAGESKTRDIDEFSENASIFAQVAFDKHLKVKRLTDNSDVFSLEDSISTMRSDLNAGDLGIPNGAVLSQTNVHVSPMGGYVVVGTKLHRIDDGKTASLPSAFSQDVSVSPNEEYISFHTSGTLEIVDIKDLNFDIRANSGISQIQSKKFVFRNIEDFSYAFNGRYLGLLDFDGRVKIVDLENGTDLEIYLNKTKPKKIAISPSGSRIALSSESGEVQILKYVNLVNEQEVSELQIDDPNLVWRVPRVEFSPSGTYLFVDNPRNRGTAVIFRVGAEELGSRLLTKLAFEYANVEGMTFSQDEEYAAFIGSDYLSLRSGAELEVENRLEGEAVPFRFHSTRSISISTDNEIIRIFRDFSDDDIHLSLYSLRSLEPGATRHGDFRGAGKADQRVSLTGTGYNGVLRVKIDEPIKREYRYPLPDRAQELWSYNGFAVSIDGTRTVAATSQDIPMIGVTKGDTRIWNNLTGQLVNKIETGLTLQTLFFDDSKRIAVGTGDGYVHIFDSHSGTYLTSIKAHNGWVTALAYQRDSNFLYSTGADGFLRIWDVSVLPDGKAFGLACQLVPNVAGTFGGSDFVGWNGLNSKDDCLGYSPPEPWWLSLDMVRPKPPQ